MRHPIGTAVLLYLPLLASARYGQYGHQVAHHHGLDRRAPTIDVVTVTKTVYLTVTAPDAVSSTSASAATSNKGALPTAGSATFHQLLSVPGSASVKNSCDYPVYLWSVGHPSCGPDNESQLIAPNSTYTESLRHCKEGGVSLKISKAKTGGKPMQFEYSIWPTNNKLVSYDISYLDCKDNKNGQKDLSQCAGHEGGIQAAAGARNDAGCPNFHCAPGEWCDIQAYVVAEFDYKPGAPVGACAVEEGITFELCAGT